MLSIFCFHFWNLHTLQYEQDNGGLQTYNYFFHQPFFELPLLLYYQVIHLVGIEQYAREMHHVLLALLQIFCATHMHI